MKKVQQFEEPPKEEKPKKKVVVPPYRFSMQYTRFKDKLPEEVIKEFGDRAEGQPHINFIGENKSACRKLFGLGYTLQSLVINRQKVDFGLTEFSNHVWCPQVNEADPDKKIMEVCLNCGSLMIDNKFYAYTDVEEQAKK